MESIDENEFSNSSSSDNNKMESIDEDEIKKEKRENDGDDDITYFFLKCFSKVNLVIFNEKKYIDKKNTIIEEIFEIVFLITVNILSCFIFGHFFINSLMNLIYKKNLDSNDNNYNLLNVYDINNQNEFEFPEKMKFLISFVVSNLILVFIVNIKLFFVLIGTFFDLNSFLKKIRNRNNNSNLSLNDEIERKTNGTSFSFERDALTKLSKIKIGITLLFFQILFVMFYNQYFIFFANVIKIDF